MKYISYDKTKGVYKVRVPAGKTVINKTADTLEDAITIRAQFYSIRRLDSNILVRAEAERRGINHVPTFSVGYAEYVRVEVEGRVKPSTLHKYLLLETMLNKYVGNTLITEITASMWQDVLTSVQADRNLSYSYMAEHGRRIVSMYNFYIRRNVVQECTCRNLSLRKDTGTKRPRRDFTIDEERRLLESLKQLWGFEWYFLYRLYFATGCRRAELAGLKWENVDFNNGCLLIRAAIDRGTVNGHYCEIYGTLKTDGSKRDIPLSLRELDVLRAMKQQQYGEPQDFVFKPGEHSRYPWTSLSTISKRFAIARDAAGLPDCLVTHSTRHTFASRLLLAGVDLPTVQSLGGWTNPATLLKNYAHSNLDAKKAALAKIRR